MGGGSAAEGSGLGAALWAALVVAAGGGGQQAAGAAAAAGALAAQQGGGIMAAGLWHGAAAGEGPVLLYSPDADVLGRV
jgi:hypothetical protein